MYVFSNSVSIQKGSIVVQATCLGEAFAKTEGRSNFETTGVAALRREFQKGNNTGLGRKMPFVDGHCFGLRLSSTYVAPVPPSQALALVNAITQRFQRPLTSQRNRFCLSTGGPGEQRPRP